MPSVFYAPIPKTPKKEFPSTGTANSLYLKNITYTSNQIDLQYGTINDCPFSGYSIEDVIDNLFDSYNSQGISICSFNTFLSLFDIVLTDA